MKGKRKRHFSRRRRMMVAAAAAIVAVSTGLAVGTAGAEDAGTKGHPASCKSSATGFLGKWGPVSKECVATTGPSETAVYVNWHVQGNTEQVACVDGRMAQSSNPRPWTSLGCGKGTKVGFPVKIPWKANAMSRIEIRVKSINSPVANVDYDR